MVVLHEAFDNRTSREGVPVDDAVLSRVRPRSGEEASMGFGSPVRGVEVAHGEATKTRDNLRRQWASRARVGGDEGVVGVEALVEGRRPRVRNCVGPGSLVTGHRRGVVIGDVLCPDEEVAVGWHVQLGEVDTAGREAGESLKWQLASVTRDAIENHPVHVGVLRHSKP